MTGAKYELLPDPPSGLMRLRALRDLPERGVRAGDLGGWIETEDNLSHAGQAWVSGEARVSGEAWVSGQARVTGQAWVTGQARVTGQAAVAGQARVTGQAWVTGQARVTGQAAVAGQARVTGQAQVSGQARVTGQAAVAGQARVTGQALVTGQARVAGWAQVAAASDIVTVGPVGSTGRWVTAARQSDGTVRIVAGCWTGTPDELRARVTAAPWESAPAVQAARWAAQYRAIADLADLITGGAETDGGAA